MTGTAEAPSVRPLGGTLTVRRAERAAWWRRASRRAAAPMVSICVGLLIWELITWAEWVNPLFLPRFSDVCVDLWELFSSGRIYPHLSASGQEYGLGMLMAVVIGVAVGLLMGVFGIVDRMLSPWVHGLYAVPRIAFVPIMIVWFGFGMGSKVATVFIMAVFPIILNTAVGAKTVDRRVLAMADSFLVSRLLNFRAIILPSSIPYILTGVRLGVGAGIIGVVVAEFFGSSRGVGFLLTSASYTFNSVRIFSMVVLLAVIGVLLTAISKAVERRFDAWRGSHDQ